eukprot:TRINITY_DN43842_c0_g1_i1.p1 TRINITY_DN43842_c0_g1~~TRINITY_DN43842_c0_g1_i1.p1  ORF type:complete len:662 (+),score=124.43 TRINITY_DN43842_c0_g1_i1:44-2029(+)
MASSSKRSRSPRGRRKTQIHTPGKEKHHRRWLDTVQVPAQGEHTSTLFYFHGFMRDAHSYASPEEDRYWQGDGGLKVILVNAPQRKVTASRDVTNAWYDYLTDKAGELCDVVELKHLEDVVAAVHRMMADEFELVGPGNVSIGGYSQGGTIALHAGLTWKGPKLGAIYAIATTLLTTTPALKVDCKVRAFHGLSDEVFPFDRWAHEGYARLAATGTDLELQVQDGVYHVDDDWEAALIRMLFRGEEPASNLKLRKVRMSQCDIDFAANMELFCRATRVAVKLMRRFQALVEEEWHGRATNAQVSMASICAQLQKWQAQPWAHAALQRRAGGTAHFKLSTCCIQSGSQSSCWPLPVAEEGEQPLPRESSVVLTLGVKRSGRLAILTRTIFVHPTREERVAYRMVCAAFERALQELHPGIAASTFRRLCTCIAEEQLQAVTQHSLSALQRGQMKINVWRIGNVNVDKESTPLPSAQDLAPELQDQESQQTLPSTFYNAVRSLIRGGRRKFSELVEIADDELIQGGAYFLTIGYIPAAVRAVGKRAAMNPIWVQDTVWVQSRQGQRSFTLTQNSSKEESCVMYEYGPEAEPKHDVDIAKKALTEIQEILNAKPTSALAKELLEVVQREEVQEVLNRDADGEEGDEGVMEGEEEEEKENDPEIEG